MSGKPVQIIKVFCDPERVLNYFTCVCMFLLVIILFINFLNILLIYFIQKKFKKFEQCFTSLEI